MFLTAYDRVRVISLPERKDRRRAMARELAGIPFEFFDAYRVNQRGVFTSPGAFGGVLSHVACLAEAAYANESVLIFEDDCKLLPEAFSYAKPSFDIVWAGWEEKSESEVIGAQCIGYTARAARLASAYIRNLMDPAAPHDPVAAEAGNFDVRIRPPYDGTLMWFIRTHPDVTTEFVPLTRQRSSRSDIVPSNPLDRIPVVRDLVEIGRKLRPA